MHAAAQFLKKQAQAQNRAENGAAEASEGQATPRTLASLKQRLYNKLQDKIDATQGDSNAFLTTLNFAFLGPSKIPLMTSNEEEAKENVRERVNSDDFLEVTKDEAPEHDMQIPKPPEPAPRLRQNNGLHVELSASVDIESDYILTSHLGDWESLYNEYSFSSEQQSWDLQKTSPTVHKQIIEAIQRRSLSNGKSRQLAWSLLAGICN